MSTFLHTIEESSPNRASPTPTTFSLPVFRTPAKKTQVVFNDRLQCVFLRSIISPKKTKHDGSEEAYKENSDADLESLSPLPNNHTEANPGTSTSQSFEEQKNFKPVKKDAAKKKLNQDRFQLKIVSKEGPVKLSDKLSNGDHNRNNNTTGHILKNKEISDVAPEVVQIQRLFFNVKMFEEEINEIKNELAKEVLNKNSDLLDLFKRMSKVVRESLNFIQEIVTAYECNAWECVEKYSSFCDGLKNIQSLIGYLQADVVTTKSRFSTFQKEFSEIKFNFDEIRNKRRRLEMYSEKVQRQVDFLKEHFCNQEDKLNRNILEKRKCIEKELNGLKIDCNELKLSTKSYTEVIFSDFTKIGRVFGDFMGKFRVGNQIKFGQKNETPMPENFTFLVSILTEKQDLLDALEKIKTTTTRLETVSSEKNLELLKITTKMYDQEDLIEKKDRVIHKLKEMCNDHDENWGQVVPLSPVVGSGHVIQNLCRLGEEIKRKDEELCSVRKQYESAKQMCEELTEKETTDSIGELKELEERENMLEKKVVDLKKQLREEDERSTELRFQIMLYKGEIRTFEKKKKQKEDKIILKQAISQIRRNSSDTPPLVRRTPKPNLHKIRPVNASLSNSPILRKKIFFKP